MKWRTLSEAPVEDILAFVKAASAAGQAVHIGTDSQQHGRHTSFCTIVAVLNPGKGGRAAYCQETVPRIQSLRERLLKEVWRSVELGLELTPLVTGDLTVHIDANSNVVHKSSQWVQELVGMAVSNGFKALIKPLSWASSHAADHAVRAQIKGQSKLRRIA